MEIKIKEDEKYKSLESNSYNYIFRKSDGLFMRWGKTQKDNPDFGLPEIADIEISTICNGPNNKPCTFCYKGNTSNGHNMSFETFKKVFHNLPKSLTQIAFGIGDIDGNPDLWKIMNYCKENDYNKVIPNITINGSRLNSELLDKLASTCGAIAISRYNADTCYNTVKKLTDRGMTQCNIHMLLSEETYDECFNVIDDIKNDSRLEKLNAVVFLSLKPKGRAKNQKQLKNPEKYKKLIGYAINNNIRFGFDSCSVSSFLNAVKDSDNYKMYESLAEPCESYLFSIYINKKGITYPCSFAENIEDGIDLTKKNLQLEDYWFHPKVNQWRIKLLNTAKTEEALVHNCRQCPIYDI